ncbi:protein-disulfide reductase DsbD domain-containing protein [uncultured Cohaesibacter sp.]|uniref:protein-disulfide reductase DsbD domain-containing protein n=1 Tax=uncultured Cohaesibacter sp. TaxID=1002546 RepID=UPI0029315C9C|nr:protein-disulfide reductase DsbD domain-containing protein [uncultured Cohaesibacter sp.]
MKYFENLAIRSGLAILALFLAALPQAMAAMTDWQQVQGGKMRLISAGPSEGLYKAGLEISLDEGWKTYWKVPGDTGLPPLFDTSQSTNVAKIDILWPVPKRFKQGDTQMLGYKEAIIFPILITPEDAQKPVTLVLDAQVGLCSELCIPFSADFSLTLDEETRHDPMSELLIDRDMALVPGNPRDDFGISRIQRKMGGTSGDHLLITALIPDGYGAKDLFVEAPENWFLPLPRKVGKEMRNDVTFSLPLEGLPKGTSPDGARLVITLTNGEEGVTQDIEVRTDYPE